MGNSVQDELAIGPKTSFPLRLYNAPYPILQSVAESLTALEMPRSGWNSLAPLFIKHDIRCREVDAYVQEYMPRFKEALARIPEGDEHDECDRTDKAVQALYVLPDVEVQDLFETFESDFREARQLFTNAEVPLIQQVTDALSDLLWKEGKAVRLTKDKVPWRAYEFLANAGLILVDEGIPLAERLLLLKSDELRELSRSLGIKSGPRKAEMVAGLAAHSATQVALTSRWPDQVFVKAHPEDSDQARPVELVALLAGHAVLMSEMIGRTYVSALSNTTRSELDGDGFIVGWEISIIDDTRCCQLCRDAARRRYPSGQPPRVPLHLACRCLLSPITRLEAH